MTDNNLVRNICVYIANNNHPSVDYSHEVNAHDLMSIVKLTLEYLRNNNDK